MDIYYYICMYVENYCEDIKKRGITRGGSLVGNILIDFQGICP